MESARQSGDLERGWLPDYLPDSARAIREFHLIDSPEAWVSLECPASCMSAIVAATTEADRTTRISSPRSNRLPWPSERDGLVIRLHGNGDVILLDADSVRAYVWRRAGGR